MAFYAFFDCYQRNKPVIYVDSGLPLDASAEVYGRSTWPLPSEVSRLGVGAVGFFSGGVKRPALQNERDDGHALIATTDTSTAQRYRTTFCALKHTRTSHKNVLL